jgi:hypothetical protein
MTGQRPAEERIALWLEGEAEGHLPDRVFDATFERTRATRRPSGWRTPSMPRLLPPLVAVGATAIVVVFGVSLLSPSSAPPGIGAPDASPTSTPTSTPAPSPSPTATPVALSPSTWPTYTSAAYGFTLGHPEDWTVVPATAPWDPDAGVVDPRHPAADHFTAPTGSVRVSAWSIPPDPGSADPGDEAWIDLTAWAAEYCRTTGLWACDGVEERAVPICLEQRDCHPAVLVPFQEEVLAFFTGGADVDPVTIVAVWRSDGDPSVAPFGGAVALLEAFLETMNVWPPQTGQP